MGIINAILLLAVVGIVGDTIAKVAKARMAGGKKVEGKLDQLQHQVDDLTAALSHQDAQLQELQDRLDFTERLLTQARDQARLAAPSDRAGGS